MALQNNPRTQVIRTAWLYSEFGNNFVKTMIRLMREKESVSVINDQIGSPTYAADLATILLEIVVKQKFIPGIYHYSNEGRISWYDFALAIKGLINSNCQVKPIPTSEFHSLAKIKTYLSVLKEDNSLREISEEEASQLSEPEKLNQKIACGKAKRMSDLERSIKKVRLVEVCGRSRIEKSVQADACTLISPATRKSIFNRLMPQFVTVLENELNEMNSSREGSAKTRTDSIAETTLLLEETVAPFNRINCLLNNASHASDTDQILYDIRNYGILMGRAGLAEEINYFKDSSLINEFLICAPCEKMYRSLFQHSARSVLSETSKLKALVCSKEVRDEIKNFLVEDPTGAFLNSFLRNKLKDIHVDSDFMKACLWTTMQNRILEESAGISDKEYFYTPTMTPSVFVFSHIAGYGWATDVPGEEVRALVGNCLGTPLPLYTADAFKQMAYSSNLLTKYTNKIPKLVLSAQSFDLPRKNNFSDITFEVIREVNTEICAEDGGNHIIFSTLIKKPSERG